MLPIALLMGKTRTILGLLSFALICVLPDANAQFYKFNSLSYAAGKHAAVVVTTSSGATGILVAVSEQPHSVQTLNPAKFSSADSASAFVKFDPATNRYTDLVLATREYKIQGNISLILEVKTAKLRIAIDQSGNVPYLTIVSDNAESPSIIGFAANQLILNLGGDLPVTLLEANKLQASRSELHPYQVQPGRTLILDGVEFDGTRIGLEFPIENPCLFSGAKISETKSSVDVKAANSRTNTSRAISDFLVLNALNDRLAVLDYTNGAFGILRPLANRDAGEIECGFTTVELKK